MCHEDIRTRLQDAIRDAYENTGQWCYIVAVFGDDQSGDVVYSCSSDLKKASYTISGANCVIDTAAAVDVQPLTTYEVESDLAGMSEAGARNSRRDLAQLQTIHDSAAALGANCSMAEAKRATGTQQYTLDTKKLNALKESGILTEAQVQSVVSASVRRESSSAANRGTLGLQLVESASTLETIVLKEAKADYEIKLIAPGKGSSAFYPKEVLQRDGPKVFTAGTHVYLNHPTQAEESARPEGDVKNLAGVLTTTASYSESHAKGPGLYARMKVFADHGQMVEDKAAHVGMSIRASGIAESGTKRDGLPVLKELTSAESVDVVTRAGAGGMILTESARGAKGDVEMTKEEIAALVEAGVTARLSTELAKVNDPLKALEARALRGDATVEATKVLSGLALAEASKQRVIDNVLRGQIPVKDGAMDVAKFGDLVTAEAKREAAYVSSLTGSGMVRGMGNAPVQIDEAEAKRIKESVAEENADAENVFKRFGLSESAAKAAVRHREVA
jgi:hypothetical protein